MSETALTVDALDIVLTQKYECKRESDQQPADPTEKDLCRYYRNKDGLLFSVSPPPDGVGYMPEMVKSIIESGRLEVVISIKMKLKPEKEGA